MENNQQKYKLVFLDTETTGNEEKDYLCSVAYRLDGHDLTSALYKPPLPVCLEAMAVTQITNKMLEDKPVFKDSPHYKELKKLFEKDDAILVAHNAEFDRKMLLKDGINVRRTICTMKVTRHLDVKDEIPNYKMQYIRFFMELEIDAKAHDAYDDVMVLEAIFDKLSEKVSVEEMLKITAEPFLLRKLTFGKHKGIPFKNVPRDYLIWLRRQDKIEGDLLYTLNHYINAGSTM